MPVLVLVLGLVLVLVLKTGTPMPGCGPHMESGTGRVWGVPVGAAKGESNWGRTGRGREVGYGSDGETTGNKPGACMN